MLSRHVFIVGLHRSGTSLLFQCLRQHPQVSGFSNTGVPEDEGQHLQDVYPTGEQLGGPGVFGFDPRAHATEEAPSAHAGSARRLMKCWAPYWDLEKPVLLEKSPPHLLRARWLQALFPDSAFILMMRHPVAAALATQKWSHTSGYSLVRHWLHCHDLFAADRPYLRRVHVIRYERFVANPEIHLADLRRFLGLAGEIPALPMRGELNAKYFSWWNSGDLRSVIGRIGSRLLLENRVRGHGYSLDVAEPLESDAAI